MPAMRFARAAPAVVVPAAVVVTIVSHVFLPSGLFPLLGGLLPVVVNGSLVFVPCDVGALVTNDLGAVLHELQYVTPDLSYACCRANYSVNGDQGTGPRCRARLILLFLAEGVRNSQRQTRP